MGGLRWREIRLTRLVHACVVLREEVSDLARTEQPLIDSKSSAKFFVLRYLDGVKELKNVGLTVVADQVVARAGGANVLYNCFT